MIVRFVRLINFIASIITIAVFTITIAYPWIKAKTQISRPAPPPEITLYDVPGMSPSLKRVLWYAENNGP